MLILAIYVPLPFCSSLILEGLGYMASLPAVPALWLGDFNMTLKPSLDRLQVMAPPIDLPTSTRFAKLICSFNLLDTWRSVHSDAWEYLCYSSSHHSVSRIDLILNFAFPMYQAMGCGNLAEIALWSQPVLGHIGTVLQSTASCLATEPFWLTLLPEDGDILTAWG